MTLLIIFTFVLIPSIFCESCPVVKIHPVNENGTALYQKGSGNELTFEWKKDIRFLIVCEHHSPIRWIFDEDRIEGVLQQPPHFNETHNEASVTSRSFLDFNNQSSYSYKAKYFLELVKSHSQIFICRSFTQPKPGNGSLLNCGESVVVGELDKTLKIYTLKSLQNDKLGRNALDKLEKDLQKEKQKKRRNKNKGCGIKLFLGLTNDSSLTIGWQPENGVKNHLLVDNAQTLHNLVRSYEQIEEKCITLLEDSDSIENCEFCEQISYDLYTHRPFTLTYSHGSGGSVALKGFFDIGDEPYFHYIWEEVSPEMMAYMDIIPVEEEEAGATDILEEIYQGENVLVKCSSSVVIFSIGTVITWNLPQEMDETKINFLNVTESDEAMPGGVFLTQAVLDLHREFLIQNGIKKIELKCISPFWNETEWFTTRKIIKFKESQLPEITGFYSNGTESFGNETLEVEEGVENVTLTCVANGLPLPYLVEIFLPSQNLQVAIDTEVGEDFVTQSVVIPRVEFHYDGVYQCRAKSTVGEDIRILKLSVVRGKWGKRFQMTMLILGIGMTLLFILSVLALLLKLRRDGKLFCRETAEAIKKFKEGWKCGGSEFMGEMRSSGSEHLEYEIPLPRWGIHSTLLGKGAFGVVQKGTIYHEDSRQSVVAVKTVQSPNDVKDFESSLMELTIMSLIGKHEHIVSLVGACTENIEKRSILIGVEFCANGDLLQYLQHRRALFTTVVEDGKILLQKEYSDYLNLIAANFCTLDLYKWGYQIASGMNFLSSKNVLHADLAARNVLLTSDNIAKISDFGLSRQLTQGNDYIKKTNTLLPWKWMAIESLKFMQFSTGSDIWSYGVTLHEIFSLGAEPWPNHQQWGHEFIQELERGTRMSRPKYATENMYTQVMLECWRNEPENRMSFEHAKNFFENAISHLNSPEGKDDEFMNSVC